MQKNLDTFILYKDIAHFKEAEEFVNIIEEILSANENELTNNSKYENLLTNIYDRLASFYSNVKQNYNRAEMLLKKNLILLKNSI